MKEEKNDFYRLQVDKSLQGSLRSIASARGIAVRDLASQVLRRFVDARLLLLTEIAKNNEEEGKKQ
jgi:propanediol dehydratase large subunit